MDGPSEAGSPARREFLPFSRPTIEDDEIGAVVDCLRSGWLTSGPRTQLFEERFRERLDVAHAVAVSSATAGLHLTLLAHGVGPGDEVIVPSLTWVSTANVVELCGARAVLADVDPHTLQIDPAEVDRLIGPRTRAVVPVHFAGAPADMDAVRDAVAGRPSVLVVADAAHALGTGYKGREVGSDGAPAVFSFHPTKTITTGEGGMVVCRDGAFADRIRRLRFHGISRSAWQRHNHGGSPRYEVVEPGLKYNLTDLQSALGVVQLAKVDRFNAARRALAERYDRLIEGLPGVSPIGRPAYPFLHAWHLYVVRLAPGIDRDAVMAALGRENIGTGLHFLCLHGQAHYRDRDGAVCGHAAAASESILSLPLHPGLTQADQDDVVSALGRVLGRQAPSGGPVA